MTAHQSTNTLEDQLIVRTKISLSSSPGFFSDFQSVSLLVKRTG